MNEFESKILKGALTKDLLQKGALGKGFKRGAEPIHNKNIDTYLDL